MSGCQASASPPDVCRDVGARIRAARQQRQLTQRAVAKRLGVSYQLVQRYERGEKLSFDRMFTLAAELRIDVDWLLTRGKQIEARAG